MTEQDPILALLGRIPFSFDLLNDCTLTEEQKVEKAREVMRELSARVVAAEAALATCEVEYADWMWRAYRSGYLDGISNPEPYEKLGYEKTVALAEAGATAYVAMLRIAAPRP